jgi:hypothetical protein
VPPPSVGPRVDGVLQVDDREPIGHQLQRDARVVAREGVVSGVPDHPEAVDRKSVEQLQHTQRRGDEAAVVRLHADLHAVPLGQGRGLLQLLPDARHRGGVTVRPEPGHDPDQRHAGTRARGERRLGEIARDADDVDAVGAHPLDEAGQPLLRLGRGDVRVLAHRHLGAGEPEPGHQRAELVRGKRRPGLREDGPEQSHLNGLRNRSW